MEISPPEGFASETTARTRAALLALLGVGSLVTLVELLLLGHTEDRIQWLPLAVLATLCGVILAFVVTKNPAFLRLLYLTCLVAGSSGLWGLVLHFQGNLAYELESNPSLGGMPLVRAAAMGSTPTLAPAAMIGLGLLGILFLYRHPLLHQNALFSRSSPTDARGNP